MTIKQNIHLIDTHCHLGHKELRENIPHLLAHADAKGVTRVICASGDLEESEFSAGLAEKYSNVFALAGVHPHEAKNAPVDTSEILKKLTSRPGVVAVGEVGLDYHYDFSPREDQRRVFAMQLETTVNLEIPVVVHTREAIDDTLRILLASEIDPTRVLFHSCSENAAGVKKMLDFGANVSFSGIVTFKKSDEVREGLKLVPLDRLMLETDAPYLSPEPVRKMRPNVPANVRHVAAHVATFLNMDMEELIRQTTRNAERFFNLRDDL